MKIILPEFGAYTRDKYTGELRVMPLIHAISEHKTIYIALPAMKLFHIMDNLDSVPASLHMRKAIYQRTEKPNCHGIAPYRLVSIE